MTYAPKDALIVSKDLKSVARSCPKGCCVKYEVNPFTNKAVMTNVKQDFNREVIV